MMKKIVLIITMLVSAHSAFSQSDKIKTVDIKTEIWCDHCSHCESCGPNIYYSIKENKGIRKVKIDDKTNTITVKYNSEKTTVAEIEKAIAMAGYKANMVNANSEAYEKLDNCCKKR